VNESVTSAVNAGTLETDTVKVSVWLIAGSAEAWKTIRPAAAEVTVHVTPPPEPELPAAWNTSAVPADGVLFMDTFSFAVLPPPRDVIVTGIVNEFPADPMMKPGVGEKLVLGVTAPTVIVGVATLNVATMLEFALLRSKLQELPDPHVGKLAAGVAALHPANVDPALATAFSVPVWLLSSPDREHVVVHEAGLGPGTKFVNETVPPPVPAKVMSNFLAAATYGPTSGPPLPSGAAPAGWTGSTPASPRARPRFRRPLPV
jgi:hypothetical protein